MSSRGRGKLPVEGGGGSPSCTTTCFPLLVAPAQLPLSAPQTSSGSWSPAGRGAEDRGRDWRDSGGGGWAAAAGRHPEQPRLLPASVGGTSPPGKHPAAHSAQASEDTQATDFRSDNPRREEARLVARELKTWSASQLQQPLEAASASSSEIGATSTTGGLLPEQEPKMNLIQLQSHHLQHQTGPDQMGSLK